MKKWITFVPIALMLAILMGLFVYMCLPEKQNIADSAFTVSFYFLRTRGLYCAVLGGMLMTAFYHLTLYVFRHRETVYLLFAIFCLISMMHFLFVREGINEIFKWIPKGVFLTRFVGILGFIWHNTITITGLYVLHRRFLLSHRKALAVYILLGITYFVFVPTSLPFYNPIGYLTILLVSMFITAVAIKSPVLKENRWTWLYFISFIFFICLSVINNFVFAGTVFMLLLLGSLFMVLSQSVLLSKNYADAFRLVAQTNANLEQLVDDRTKDLQSTNNAMKELVSNISHDLKTPLAVMSVNLEDLLGRSQTLTDEEYQRCVRTAYQKNLDLQRLIQNLMEINRIETGQNLLKPGWVALSELLSVAQDKYDDYLKGKGIFFEIYYTASAEIYVDAQRIWSVFDNIIYNAARYTGSGGVITINAVPHEKTVTVTITDTGCGIAPEHLPHIFERFYKVSVSRSGGDGDSGLGLYIVKSIMEAFCGSVAAESEMGKGTSLMLNFVKK